MKPALACLLLLAPAARAQIFADVSTTLGEFTIQLDHVKAPRTVASFLRLAEGNAPWIDQATGIVRHNTPYYDGVTFHRVIAGFMNQTGSRNGLGTDGPGYTFKDEVDNGLTHSGPYLASMANSGPNTNGSQIFITVRATPELNGKHTVFGHVTTGQGVCDLINAVSTDANDKPLTDVSINSVAIRREDAAALAFDEHAQMVPTISVPEVAVQHDSNGTMLNFSQPARSQAFCYHSSDLQDWSPVERFLDAEAAPAGTLDMSAETAGQPRHFFATSVVNYPADAVFPSSLVGRALITSTPLADFQFTFNPDGTGTWFIEGVGGNGMEYLLSADPYGANLLMYLYEIRLGSTPFPWMKYRLGHDQIFPTILGGRETGQLATTRQNLDIPPNNINAIDISGTFTLTR